ncbi:asparagine synthase [Methanosalsum zhilinae DSM 4017]|uniref:Asparagine synthase n=1 Tax=Methanosalsum zhilinae (strain DSM 4017 / NBRC 107636 / OCM 62 / WeN5) TaxID=679901 RepID=F7XQQ1_METZD|nr:ATP-dependent sacrificial sulfur transferase LarE [Methanosalsum zhilinae]AEH61651.1 asparagine synthase [Methanosalsum zhilinae DSM 4017]
MIDEKIEKIGNAIREKEKVMVAFSGGVDSSTLAAIACRNLGNNAIAVTADSAFMPRSEVKNAQAVAEEMGIQHHVILFDELKNMNIMHNSQNRCYYCKKSLIDFFRDIAKKEGFTTLIEGTNASEIKGYRPGLKALEEADDFVYSPFKEFGVTKEEVREMASAFQLSIAHKPSVGCLATRIPYGDPITLEKLLRIERAEDYLYSLGFSQLRVRDHNGLARIEILPEQFSLFLKMHEEINKYILALGFCYITLDVQGFRSGSMDEVL